MISINLNILASPNCWTSINPYPFSFTIGVVAILLSSLYEDVIILAGVLLWMTETRLGDDEVVYRIDEDAYAFIRGC